MPIADGSLSQTGRNADHHHSQHAGAAGLLSEMAGQGRLQYPRSAFSRRLGHGAHPSRPPGVGMSLPHGRGPTSGFAGKLASEPLETHRTESQVYVDSHRLVAGSNLSPARESHHFALHHLHGHQAVRTLLKTAIPRERFSSKPDRCMAERLAVELTRLQTFI